MENFPSGVIMKGKYNPLDKRLPRFDGCGQIKAIVRNSRSRCACFWLDVANVSGSGIGIVYGGHGFVPFAVNDELQLTLDTTCAVFVRPLHVKVCVKWREEEDGHAVRVPQTTLGCQIMLVDPIHVVAWKNGLEKLAVLQTGILPHK
jgi:hypothetical protein